MRTIHLTWMLSLICLLGTILCPEPVLAQRGKGGPALAWTNDILVLPNTLRYNDSTLQAFSFTVYETDAKELIEFWRVDHSSKSTSIAKGDPLVATGSRIEVLSNEPISVLAQAKGDKKAGTATMTIAFLPQASGSLAPLEIQEKVVREMAVRYNRNVVERQIREEEKALDRSSGKLAKSVSKVEKLNKNVQKTNASLNKVQAKRMKEQTRNAKLQGDLVGAEHAYTMSSDVKDLKRMTKARNKLSSGESKVAKLMEQEAKIRSTLTRYSGDLPSSARTKEEHSNTVSTHSSKIEALRKKMNVIQ